MPGFLAGAFLDPLDLVAAPLGPADVHARQHLRPVLGLGAAGAGMDLEEAVVAVGLAGEQRLQLGLPGGLAELAQRRLRLGDEPVVALGLGQLQHLDVFGEGPRRGRRAWRSLASRRVRSRITACASSGRCHRSGSSARMFSSPRRATAAS